MSTRRRDPEDRSHVSEGRNPKGTNQPKGEATRNRFGDPSFERYASDAGFGGPGTWYTHSDDSGGGLYAPQDDHTGRGPKNYRRSDENLYEEVCEALYHDRHVDASDIEVKVQNGDVFLTGSVHTRAMKRIAEQTIEKIQGVNDIQNWLAITPSEKKEPSAR